MGDCCSKECDALEELATKGRRGVLIMVLVINLVMFIAEFGAGIAARSTALMADSVDMLGDASVYALSLYALSRGFRWKAGASMFKGGIILLFGAWIVAELVDKLRHGTILVEDRPGGGAALVVTLPRAFDTSS